MDYGTFSVGVSLFSFTGNGCFGEVTPLPPSDLFIAQADTDQSLNIANSFYSRSGTDQAPLEQFSSFIGPGFGTATSQLPGTNFLDNVLKSSTANALYTD